MNCEEAQKDFADLLDDSRDERLRKVNDHLAACARCREELAAVAACQRLVSALPPVEPPTGFASRVMADVRHTAHRPTVRQRLCSPLQITRPLQAMAVILISVLAVFVYQKESGQRQSTTTVPSPSRLPKQAEADRLAPVPSGAPALESKMPKPGATGAQETKLNPSSQSEQLLSPAKPQEGSNIIGGLGSSQSKEESSSADRAGSVRQEQSLRSGGAQAKGVPSSAPLHDNTAAQDRTSGGASRSAELQEKSARSSLDALGSSTAGFSERELILRLKQSARNDRSSEAPSEMERPQAGASPSQTRFKDLDEGQQRAIQTGQPQTVSAIIDASQYDGFKKELARLGKIESEAPAPSHDVDALSKFSQQLRITITILPPNSSAQPPSTR